MSAAVKPERACSKCGCTDRRACQGGCFWIGPKLCSACGRPARIFQPLKATKAERRRAIAMPARTFGGRRRGL